MKHWSSTQASIALSSAEAEFGGVVRGAGQGLGYQALLSDLGVSVPLRVWTDSSAAVGICQRQGLGKLRHLDTQTLWVQQAIRTGRVDLRKVLGERNPADLLTKHSLSRARLEMLVKLRGCKYLEGRAEIAPKTRKSASTKVTMADATEDLGAVQVEEEPEMPHLLCNPKDLDAMYPKLDVPDEDLLDDERDNVQDQSDHVFTHGLKIAAKIQADMREVGRIRRPQMSPIPRPPTSRPQTATHERNGNSLHSSTLSSEMLKELTVNQHDSLSMIRGAASTNHRRSEKTSRTVSTGVSLGFQES